MLTKEQINFLDTYDAIVEDELNKLDVQTDYHSLKLTVKKYLSLVDSDNKILNVHLGDVLFNLSKEIRNENKSLVQIKKHFKNFLEEIKRYISPAENDNRPAWGNGVYRKDAIFEFVHAGGAEYIDRLMRHQVSGYPLERSMSEEETLYFGIRKKSRTFF